MTSTTDSSATREYTPELLSEMYLRMLRIRLFDDAACLLAAKGEVPGAVHTSTNQEASVVGATLALRESDYMTGNHRSHGHPIGKGSPLRGLMAELLGKKTGVCQGKGGSMHLADFNVGSLGESGIVGSSVPVAVGAALSAKVLGRDNVALAFFGDGGANTGAVHEAMNLAAVWKAPVVFVAEVNGFAELTPYDVHVPVPSLAERGAAYGIPATTVDAIDIFAVIDAARECIERARSGEGPSLLELRTLRWRGHYEGDPQRYRDPEELERRATVDPIDHLVLRLREAGVAEEELTAAVEAVDAELDEALREARSGPMPDGAAALEDVYTAVGGQRA